MAGRAGKQSRARKRPRKRASPRGGTTRDDRERRDHAPSDRSADGDEAHDDRKPRDRTPSDRSADGGDDRTPRNAAKQAAAERPSGTPASGPRRVWAKLWWLIVPVAVALAYRSVRSFELSADARFLIADNRFVRDLSFWQETLAHDYFWSSSGNQIPYYRPLTKLSWLLEYQVFGADAGGYHLVQLAWFVLGVLGVQLLARSLGISRVWAVIAAALFGLHPVAIAPTSLVMARSDVVATAMAVWAVLGWLRWQTGERSARAWAAVHVLATLLALASKEAAVIVPAVLLGFAWADRRLRERWPSLLPSAGLTALYLLIRRRVLAAEDEAMNQIGLELEPLRLFAGLTKYLRGLWPFQAESPIRDLAVAEARSTAFVVLGIFTLLVLAGSIVLALRQRDRRLLVLFGWAILALAPVLLVERILVPTSGEAFALADRWLLFALPAAMLALVCVAAHAEARLSGRYKRWFSSMVGVATAGWGLFMLLGNGELRSEFRSEAGLLDNEDRLYRATPERFRTQQDVCRFYERKVVRVLGGTDPEAVIERSQRLIERCGPSPTRNYYLFSALMRAGRLREAAPLAAQLVNEPPRDRRGHGHLSFLLGRLALAQGKHADAARWLGRAYELGYRDCRLFVLLGEAAHGQGRAGDAAKHLLTAYRCGNGRDPSLLLAAATWLARQGDEEGAAKLLALARHHSLSADQRAQANAIAQALAGKAAEPKAPQLR